MYEKVTKIIFWIYIDKSITMNDQYIDLFERYIKNQLSKDEKQTLEQNLQTDVVLKNEFNTFKTLHAGIRVNVLQDKLKMLKELDAPTDKVDKQSSLSSTPKYWIISLLLLGLLSVIIYYFAESNTVPTNLEEVPQNSTQPIQIDDNQNESTDTLVQKTNIPFVPKNDNVGSNKTKAPSKKREVVAEANKKTFWQKAISVYQSPASFAMILRDNSGTSQDTYKKAVALFTAKKYNDVIALIKDLQDEKSQYLLAHAYFLAGLPEQAIPIFRPMATDDFSMFYDDAKWYLSLSLLAQFPESKDELTSLLNDLEKTSKYGTQVEKIKDQLK